MHIVRAGGLEGFQQLVKSMGYNPNDLLRAVDLDPAVIRQPDIYVPYEKVAELLRDSATRCHDPLFGLKLSTLQGRRTLGLLGLFMSLQPTIAQGLAIGSRFGHFHATGVSTKRLDVGSFTLLELELDLPESIGLEQLRQLSIGLMYRVSQQLIGNSWKPLKVLLRQPEPPGGIRAMEQHFGCPVACASELDGLMLDNRILAQPPSAPSAQMQEFLDEHIQSMEANFPDNIVEQVRHTIVSLLPISECNLSNVARVFNLHPRVLQQRLSQRGTGFQRLLDETRSKIARQYLQHTKMSLTDIALNLGFAELAVFSRAFKRWMGMSPSIWRRMEANK